MTHRAALIPNPTAHPFRPLRPCHPRRHAGPPDAGFTLIESLVALVVLALSSVALLTATQSHIARIGALETRAAAGWVTENQLAELTLGSQPSPSPPAMLGRSFRIDQTTTPTKDPDLLQVTLTATAAGTAQPLSRLTGFLDARAQP